MYSCPGTDGCESLEDLFWHASQLPVPEMRGVIEDNGVEVGEVRESLQAILRSVCEVVEDPGVLRWMHEWCGLSQELFLANDGEALVALGRVAGPRSQAGARACRRWVNETFFATG